MPVNMVLAVSGNEKEVDKTFNSCADTYQNNSIMITNEETDCKKEPTMFEVYLSVIN